MESHFSEQGVYPGIIYTESIESNERDDALEGRAHPELDLSVFVQHLVD